MGVRSLPVQLGAERAARLACIVMAVPQMVVALLLVAWGHYGHAVLVAAVLLGQIGLMTRLLRAPRELAPWYNATGITLYVSGMMVAAFAIRPDAVLLS
jgi:chlorophyll synthase